MRTASVYTHLRCNQRCSYCTVRRAEDDRAFMAKASVEQRITSALSEGATEIAFSGGEPTMRGDLASLIAFARTSGATRVVLETNATLVDDELARTLRLAGLDAARVNLVGFDPSIDAITRDEGGFERTRTGVSALLDANIEVSIRAAVVRSTRDSLVRLPLALAAAWPTRIAGLSLVVPSESPDETELLSPAEIASAVSAIAEAARRSNLSLKLAPETSPPPCTFPDLGRVAHLFSLTRGATPRADRRHVAACDACMLRDRCTGFSSASIARFGSPDVGPIVEDRMRRRLSLITNVDEQVSRELVTRDRYWDTRTGAIEEDLIRVNFHCNQSCRFCFVSTHLPAAARVAIEAAILDAGRAGRRITLSGGEPTLNSELADFVRLAKANSSFPIRIQTNAIRLAAPALTDAIVEAGVSEAFVSLHGATAAVGDAVTHAPGTFEKTVLGIDNLVDRGVYVVLNFVICGTNMAELPAYVELVADRWPTAAVNVSFVAPSTDVVPRDRELIPRYSDAVPHLAKAFAIAEARGVKLVGFESMCGIPLCLVPSSLDAYYALGAVAPDYDRGEFVHPEVCGGCDLRERCYGVRRGYVELHGAGELHAIRQTIA